MGSFSKVVLLGNLTRDPSTGTLPSGATVCEFGLAVNRPWKDADGQMRDEVLFMDCAAYGKSGQTMGQYLKKGNPVLVEGHLKLDRWQDDQGNARSKVRTVVERFQFIGRGEQAQPDQTSGANRTGKPVGKRKRSPAGHAPTAELIPQEVIPV
jgi:single-strand DNA-binding protein